MFDYIIGKITDIQSNYIILENNNIGYVIYNGNPYAFKLGEEYKVYLYQHIREDENTLYGFLNTEEKKMFLKLINVKGLGPKMTLPILATGSVTGIMDAIERENILYLTKFPKIGEKIARQIILDLKGKLVSTSDNVIGNNYDELKDVLLELGYKQKDIQRILPHINNKLEIEVQIKEALRLLLK